MSNPLFESGDIKQALVQGFAEEDMILLKDVLMKNKGGGGCTATVAIIKDGILHLANGIRFHRVFYVLEVNVFSSHLIQLVILLLFWRTRIPRAL